VRVWCDTCDAETLLNARKVCSWCNTKLSDKNIKKAEKESR